MTSMTNSTAHSLIQRLAETLTGLRKHAAMFNRDTDEMWVAVKEAVEAVEAEARAYLSQSEPEPAAGPTDEELLELWTAWNVGWDPRRGPVVMPHPAEYARAVLARYGRP